MKKWKNSLLVMLLVCMMLLPALAEDLGVQVIGSQSGAHTPVTLDDIQLEVPVEIDGYAEITPIFWIVKDCFLQRQPDVLDKISVHKSEYGGEIKCDQHYEDKKYMYYKDRHVKHYVSGTQAEFAILDIDVMNTTTKSVDFIKDATVKVIFDDRVEYQGWIRQKDYDLNICTWLDPSNNFPIDPYYVGHYVFGCTLPNPVVESKLPLRMVINMGGNEITYHIRK